MPLIWFGVALLLGVVAGDGLRLSGTPTAVIAGGLVVLTIVWWPRRDAWVPLLLAAVFVGGAARMAVAQPAVTERSVWAYTGRSVVLNGVVARQPDRREDKQSAVIAAELLLLEAQPRPVDGLVLLKLPPQPELRYGQRVTVEGRLDAPQSGDDFDYRAYLARHGIHALMAKPELTIVPEIGGSWWQRASLRLNDRARRTGSKRGSSHSVAQHELFLEINRKRL